MATVVETDTVLEDGSYTALKEQVEAGDVEDLSVREEYAVRRKMVEEMYDDERDEVDAYRRDKRLRGFDKKAKKRSYKNRAGRYGAGIGAPAGGILAFQTLGVAGSLLAWPMVAGAAVAGGAGAGLSSYYGMGKIADRVIEGRNTYVEKRA
ncbi:MAG: hypothetical protein SVU32_08380, partial [Candidatus Nanohaloarchaea archaeon]|nr:hypothetical protein [Candidatus Nanohaloarchaea archaeon]